MVLGIPVYGYIAPTQCSEQGFGDVLGIHAVSETIRLSGVKDAERQTCEAYKRWQLFMISVFLFLALESAKGKARDMWKRKDM